MAINSGDFKLRLVDKPKQVYISERNCAVQANAVIPPSYDKQVNTEIKLIYRGAQTAKILSYEPGDYLFACDTTLRHEYDKLTKTDSWRLVTYNPIELVDESFCPYNNVILFGRIAKDIDPNNSMDLKYINDLIICNRSIVCSVAPQQGEFFNIFAVNKVDAPNYNLAQNLADQYPKGTNVVIKGVLVTDGWTDKNTKEQRTSTKIKLLSINKAYVNTDNSAVNAYVSNKKQEIVSDTVTITADTMSRWSATENNEEVPF